MATQTVIGWINRKFYASRNKHDFEQMESFCLLWNVFEKKVGNGSSLPLRLSGIQTFIDNNIASINIDSNTMATCLRYFRERYVTNGITNDKFTDLRFRSGDALYEDNLKNILTNNSTITDITEREKIQGVLTIAYRIRNNSFHGTKGLNEIVEQEDTFEHLNNFLMNFLEGFPLI